MNQRKPKEAGSVKNQKEETVPHEKSEQTSSEGISADTVGSLRDAVLGSEVPEGDHSAVPTAQNATAVFVGVDEASGGDKTVTSLLMKDHAVTLHKGDVVVVCSEPGFRRAGMAHPHVRVHEDGDLTKEQLALLRAEPKITVIVIGG